MEGLGKTIKMLRINAGIKQKDLAKKVLISPNYLCLVEKNRRMPSISVLRRIAEKLGVPISYIFWYAYDKKEGQELDRGRDFS